MADLLIRFRRPAVSPGGEASEPMTERARVLPAGLARTAGEAGELVLRVTLPRVGATSTEERLARWALDGTVTPR